MAKDPICGMMVDEKTAKWTSEYNFKKYYFCNERCKIAFDKNPKHYVKTQPFGACSPPVDPGRCL
jgi:YHS domain-containing protein